MAKVIGKDISNRADYLKHQEELKRSIQQSKSAPRISQMRERNEPKDPAVYFIAGFGTIFGITLVGLIFIFISTFSNPEMVDGLFRYVGI